MILPPVVGHPVNKNNILSSYLDSAYINKVRYHFLCNILTNIPRIIKTAKNIKFRKKHAVTENSDSESTFLKTFLLSLQEKK